MFDKSLKKSAIIMSDFSENAFSVTGEIDESSIIPVVTRAVPSLSSLCSPSIPSSLLPIDLSVPLHLITKTISYPKGEIDMAQDDCNHQEPPAVSLCPKMKRFKCKKEAFYKAGLREHWFDQKRLISAVQNRSESKVSELLDFGLDPNISDSKQRTPLHIAASHGDHRIIRLLLSKRADPTQKDILGNTPLHLAVCRGDLETVRILIENGSNIFIRDNTGRTPLSLVRNRLAGVRRNKASPTHAFKTEFILMSQLLCSSAARQNESESFVYSIDDLCNQMQSVSTREKADEIAEAAIQQMSSAVSTVSLSNIPQLL